MIGAVRAPSSADATLPPRVTSVSGQYRAVLDRHGPLEEIDTCLRERPGPEHWSVLESLAHVADGLHLAARNTVTLLDGDHRCFPVHMEAPRAEVDLSPCAVCRGFEQADASGRITGAEAGR